MHLIRLSQFVNHSRRETLINLDAIRKVQARKEGEFAILDIWLDDCNGSPTPFFPIDSGGDDSAIGSPKEALKGFKEAVAAYTR